jgi:hypothetical protein
MSQLSITVSDIRLCDKVNFAIQTNNWPMIESLTLTNTTDESIKDLTLEITSSPAFCRCFIKQIDEIEAHTSLSVHSPELVLDAEYLADNTEQIVTALSIRILNKERLLGSYDRNITVLAYNELYDFGTAKIRLSARL